MALIKLTVLWQNYAVLDALFYMLLFNVKLVFIEKTIKQAFTKKNIIL